MSTLQARATKDTKIDISTNDDLHDGYKQFKPSIFSRDAVKKAFLIIGNVSSSVGLILTNKFIVDSFGFSYVILLTMLHFAFLAVFFSIFIFLGLIETKELPTRAIIYISFMNVGSIVFMNFSLHANSVEFYQFTKLACIPMIVILETYMNGKIFSSRVKFSLFLVIVGVGIATITDVYVSFNLVGGIYGAIAVLTTALSQIALGENQKAHGLSPIQMLEAIIGPQFIISLLFAIPLDVLPHFHDINILVQEGTVILLIILSCILSILVNFFTIALIGTTSAITFQVISNTKTCLILILGFLTSPSSVSLLAIIKNITGIVIAILGVIAYGHYKAREPANLQRKSSDK
jgi:solute carrier family 35 protein E3